MTKLHRRFAHKALLKLRQTPLRSPITKTLVRMHNSSYHWISFFASHKGIHPKHDIMNYHQFFIDHVEPGDTVVDLGSGLGEVASDVAKKAKHVVGIDNNQAWLKRASAKHQRPNLEFRYGDITSLPSDQHYDVAILSNVLEHIEDRVKLLQHISTITPTILIRVPMITRDWITVYKKQIGLEYRLDHTHYIEYSEEFFRQEMVEANLVITSLNVRFGELYAVCHRQQENVR